MLVSVYLPTRNRAKLLAKAVDSVLNQSYKDIELVVVDDASTDDTAEFLRERAARDRRLVYFRNQNAGGAPAARNRAITGARGEFVTGLDDDDEFHVERISAFVEYWDLLTKRGIRPACLFSQEIWVRNGVPHLTTKKRGNVSFSELFEGNHVGNHIFAPKAHFVGAGLFDEKLPAWQDLDMFMRVLMHFGEGHLLDMATYYYDDTPRTDRISRVSQNVRDAFEIVHSKYTMLTSRQSQQLFLQMFGEFYPTKPGVHDWVRFFRWGVWPKGVIRLMVATTRSLVRG